MIRKVAALIAHLTAIALLVADVTRADAPCEQKVSKDGKTMNLGNQNPKLTEIPECVFNYTNMEKLYLMNNNISIIPPEIGNLKSLTVLVFYGNDISIIPPEIGNLTSLSYLNLENNNISSIPPEIGNLTNLTYLSLGNNNISSIPPEIGNLIILTYLVLYDNDISIIPPEIGRLIILTHLYLYNNPIERLPVELIDLNVTQVYLKGGDSHAKSSTLCLPAYGLMRNKTGSCVIVPVVTTLENIRVTQTEAISSLTDANTRLQATIDMLESDKGAIGLETIGMSSALGAMVAVAVGAVGCLFFSRKRATSRAFHQRS